MVVNPSHKLRPRGLDLACGKPASSLQQQGNPVMITGLNKCGGSVATLKNQTRKLHIYDGKHRASQF